eukprot:TRINITY_DN6370_c0_g1_i2.p1 TRINITY_DN6370_c0_g1~~TRINITY_DN6370_c0_g1_i2.p1  ORF type:complete len:397 (+),score=100.40 TRINITY_DN6370_c0_g1_i2:820-2010(+)
MLFISIIVIKRPQSPKEELKPYLTQETIKLAKNRIKITTNRKKESDEKSKLEAKNQLVPLLSAREFSIPELRLDTLTPSKDKTAPSSIKKIKVTLKKHSGDSIKIIKTNLNELKNIVHNTQDPPLIDDANTSKENSVEAIIETPKFDLQELNLKNENTLSAQEDKELNDDLMINNKEEESSTQDNLLQSTKQSKTKHLEEEVKEMSAQLRKELDEKSTLIALHARRESELHQAYQEMLAKHTKELMARVFEATCSLQAVQVQQMNSAIDKLALCLEKLSANSAEAQNSAVNAKSSFAEMTYEKFEEILKNDSKEMKEREVRLESEYERRKGAKGGQGAEEWYQREKMLLKAAKKKFVANALKKTAEFIEPNGCNNSQEAKQAVSYTHLTLPTICSV